LSALNRGSMVLLFVIQVTWERIDCFLPNLRNDLVATQSPVSIRATSPPEPDIPSGMTMHASEETQGVVAQPEASTEEPAVSSDGRLLF